MSQLIKNHFRLFIGVIFFIIISVISIVLASSYRLVKQSPEISVEEIESIQLEILDGEGFKRTYIGDFDRFVEAFNSAKKVKEVATSTWDRRLEINLKGGDQICLSHTFREDCLELSYKRALFDYVRMVQSKDLVELMFEDEAFVSIHVEE